MISVIRTLGGRTIEQLEGLGRVAVFGGLITGAIFRGPTRFGFFVRAKKASSTLLTSTPLMSTEAEVPMQ